MPGARGGPFGYPFDGVYPERSRRAQGRAWDRRDDRPERARPRRAPARYFPALCEGPLATAPAGGTRNRPHPGYSVSEARSPAGRAGNRPSQCHWGQQLLAGHQEGRLRNARPGTLPQGSKAAGCAQQRPASAPWRRCGQGSCSGGRVPPACPPPVTGRPVACAGPGNE